MQDLKSGAMSTTIDGGADGGLQLTVQEPESDAAGAALFTAAAGVNEDEEEGDEGTTVEVGGAETGEGAGALGLFEL
jgi:hypothetical protein